METQDCIKNGNNNKYDPVRGFPFERLPENLGTPSPDQEGGIVKINPATYTSQAEFYRAQEHHNANHALYYFSMITAAAIQGRSTGHDSEKLARIKAHLMNLREFLGDDRPGLKATVETLLTSLENFRPASKWGLALFIYRSWPEIRFFAEAYGQRMECFPEENFQKLTDIVLGRHFPRLWWWKMIIGKLAKSAPHFWGVKLAKYFSKKNNLTSDFDAFFNNKMQVVLHILANPRTKRDSSIVTQVVNSLNDIFHHFCPKDRRLEEFFEELIGVLKKYPDLTDEDCAKGNKVAGELLKALGRKAAGNEGRDE